MILEGRVHLPFEYAAGVAASRFLTALRDECKILGARCLSCRFVWVPLSSFCPRCGRDSKDILEIAPVGTLRSWTVIHEQGVHRPFPPPITYGLIQLDGAHSSMVHRILCPEEHVKTGMRVRAKFSEKRVGSILDIEGFEPVREANG
jgi:hypothetical protein